MHLSSVAVPPPLPPDANGCPEPYHKLFLGLTQRRWLLQDEQHFRAPVIHHSPTL